MVNTPLFVGFHTCQVLSWISCINSSMGVDLCFYWWGWGPEVEVALPSIVSESWKVENGMSPRVVIIRIPSGNLT